MPEDVPQHSDYRWFLPITTRWMDNDVPAPLAPSPTYLSTGNQNAQRRLRAGYGKRWKRSG
ncbi:MAG: hypothetical protein O7F73_13860 [Gammaproteobacteria bacterium]|nr:hypothetical protein [Gammaproteobacteria bacterium]